MKKTRNLVLSIVMISILSLSTACSACGNKDYIPPEDMVSTEIKEENLPTESTITPTTTESKIIEDLNSAGESVSEMVTDIGNAAMKAAKSMQP